MARPYTHVRFYLMQAVMWLLLGGTIVFALLASSYRRNALAVKLDAPLTARGLSVRLPARWEITRYRGRDSAHLFRATSPDAYITIDIDRPLLPTDSTPLEYLRRIGEAPPA